MSKHWVYFVILDVLIDSDYVNSFSHKIVTVAVNLLMPNKIGLKRLIIYFKYHAISLFFVIVMVLKNDIGLNLNVF